MFILPLTRIVELNVMLCSAVCARGAWSFVIFLPGGLYACGLGVPFRGVRFFLLVYCWTHHACFACFSSLSISVGVWMFGSMVCVGGVGVSVSLLSFLRVCVGS